MNYLKHTHLSGFLFVAISTNPAMATEEAKYSLISKDKKIEIRHYTPQIIAETIVDADIEKAGNIAFKLLFGYISGNNITQSAIAMTAPVGQESTSEEIAMTVPVRQEKSKSGWAVNFKMPSSYTIETLPRPSDSRVKLRQISSQTVAAIRYSGFWSKSNYLEHKSKLKTWIQQSNYQVNGDAIWARYNAPFTPWFLRRNEILIPVVKNN
jgi:effector-binding domain-containing protein